LLTVEGPFPAAAVMRKDAAPRLGEPVRAFLEMNWVEYADASEPRCLRQSAPVGLPAIVQR